MDYAPSPTDDSVLQRPSKQELMPEDMTDVFGYPRDLRRRCGEGLTQRSGQVTGFWLSSG